MNNNICEICGCEDDERLKYKKVRYRRKLKMVLCCKHFIQYKKYGKFLDTNRYTIWDMNEIYIRNGIGHIIIRNNIGEMVAEALIDIDDIDKVNQHKWRISKKGNKTYVVSGLPSRHESIYLARFIMDCKDKNLIIDHISGNELDNRKSNLRVATKGDNARNAKAKCISQSGIRGVSYDKKNKLWKVDFCYHNKRYYPISYKTKEEATYLRYLFEINFLKEFRYTSNDELYFNEINKLTQAQKQEIENYFETKTGINIEKSRV